MANQIATNVTTLPSAQLAQPSAVRTVSSWRGVRPTTMDEAWKMSKVLARAPNMLPRSYVEENRQPRQYEEIVAMVFSAIQMGAEVGLSPMAAVQNIAVINGKPGLYGPAMLAVVEASGLLQMIEESISGTMQDRNMEAVCTVQRVGRQPRTFNFSYEDASLAKLIGKAGPWSQYPKRMFIARARTFALRDVFPDVLSGLSQSVEELLDIPAEEYCEIKIQVPPGESLDDLLEPQIDAVGVESDVKEKLKAVHDLKALDDLWRSGISAKVREIGATDKAAMNRIISAFSVKKNEILKAEPEAEQEAAGDAPDASEPEEATHAAEAAEAPLTATQEATLRKVKQDLGVEPGDTKKPVPPPATIAVPNEDGKPAWNRWAHEALAQLKTAGTDDYGIEWVRKWLAMNAENIVRLREHNEDWAGRVEKLHAKVVDHFTAQREDADAQANAQAMKHFPTIAVEYGDDENPDWNGFADKVRGYIRETPNHFVAASWWKRHTPIIGNLRAADPAIAEALEAAFAKAFPQLAAK